MRIIIIKGKPVDLEETVSAGERWIRFRGMPMNAMLVGADRLGNIPDRLAALGITVSGHISGRDAAHQKRLPALPRNLDLLILFTDFIGHNVMKSFRNRAQADGVRVVACRRSASALEAELSRCLGTPGGAGCAECPMARPPRPGAHQLHD